MCYVYFVRSFLLSRVLIFSLSLALFRYSLVSDCVNSHLAAIWSAFSCHLRESPQTVRYHSSSVYFMSLCTFSPLVLVHDVMCVCVCVHFVSLLPIQSILLALSLLHHAIALIPPHALIFGFWFSFKAYLYSLISTQIEWFGFFSVRVYLIYSLPCAQKRNWNVSHFLSTFAWVCSLLCAGPRTKRYTYIWFVHFDRRCIGHQHVMSLSEWKRPRESERERE